uniref:Regulator of G protein signaling 1 n=1 Tax=Callorhinchus milii TaxID=7868 RepID=A0A4W3K3D5_CALMI|eukprot:gi/632956230/ref/XP_007893856.1/ PREDICTED: regulator of G-protein signaling 21-like [Callorhinchus milii]
MPEIMFPQTPSIGLKEGNSNSAINGDNAAEKKKPKNIAKDLKTRLFSMLVNSGSQQESVAHQPSMSNKVDFSIGLTHDEAIQWSKSLEMLLTDPRGLAAFRGFLKSEFSEENIDFWLVCEDYRKTKTPEKLASKAKHIYTEFIKSEAPKQVNIDFQTRELVGRSILQPSNTCFDGSQKIIFNLMEKDSYPRFLKSDVYLNLINRPQAKKPNS